MLDLWVVEKLPALPQAKLAEEMETLEALLNQTAAAEELPLESFLK